MLVVFASVSIGDGLAQSIETFDVPNGTQTRPSGINAAGQVVGSFTTTAGQTHAFSWTGTSGFLDPGQPKRLMERFRRMLARGGLEREEVKFLRGMLAAFEKGMRREK